MQKTIFIVDDNVTNLAKAEEVLEHHYLVITLTSAQKMFVVLEKIKPHLILLDIDMPDMDGLEAIKLLKEDKRYSSIPVIFVTGFTDADTEAYGIELGAVDLITKPFSEPVLLNRIKNHLNIDSSIRELSGQFERQQRVILKAKDALKLILKDKDEHINHAMREEIKKVIDTLDFTRDDANGANQKVSERLLRAFLHDANKAVAMLEAFMDDAESGKSCEDEELRRLTTCIHGMKSALIGINEPDMSALALKLEYKGRAKDSEAVISGIPVFLDGLRALIININNR